MPTQRPRDNSDAHPGVSRRDFLRQAGGGLGALALWYLLEQERARQDQEARKRRGRGTSPRKPAA